VRFARHLTAVLLIVAAVVALGVAWAHSAEASWLAGPAAAHPAKFVHAEQRVRILRASSGGNGPGLSLADSGDLVHTAVVEAAIMAVVVAASAVRRHRRRARRAAA